MPHTDSHSAEIAQSPHEHHVLPVSVYGRVYILLLIGLIATYGVAQVDLGSFNIVVALAVAICKTVLVVFYFMGVKYATRLTWLWAAIGFIWVLLLFGTAGDYATREWIHVSGW